MTVTLVSSTVGADPGTVLADFYKFQAKDPAVMAQALGKGNARFKVTSTDATPGVFVTLTGLTLDPAAGPLSFDAGTARTLRVKAIGKTAGATTNVEHFEQCFLIIGGSTPVVIGGAVKAFDLDNNTVAGSVTATAGVGSLTLSLTGKAASNITWYIDVTVDDPIAVD